MSKCLITKLNGVVNDSTLLKLGEFRMKVEDGSIGSINHFIMQSKKDVGLEVIGDGYFTNEGGTTNLGSSVTCLANRTTTLYVSQQCKEISVSSKYPMVIVNANTLGCDISYLKYSPYIKEFVQKAATATGDISSLKDMTSMVTLQLSSAGITGDISSLKDMTSMVTLQLSSAGITGDISSLKDMTSMRVLKITSNISGDISNLQKMTNLTTCYLNYVTGDVAAFQNMEKLSDVRFTECSFSGDLSKMPNNFAYLSLNSDKSSSFTWKTTRPSTAYIVSISGAPFMEDLDAMLINQANCAGTSSNKVIFVRGTRTSASDDAVAALQEKGYTVSITAAS